MAEYDVTAPDGRTFTVTAPDGAPQDQVLSYAKAQFAKMPAKRPALADIGGGKVLSALAEAPVHALEGLDKLAHGVGGKVTDALAGGSIPPEVAAAAGTAANLATGQAPMMALGGLGGLLSKVPLRAAAETTLQSALKPSVKALEGVGPTGPNADRAIATMLDEGAGFLPGGYNISRGGIEKMQGKVDALRASVEDALKNSGATIDRDAIASRLDTFVAHIKDTDLAPQDRLAAIKKLSDDILANTHMPQQIPVERAQRIKQDIYARISKAYGELGSDAVQAQKSLARGAKEEISAAVPEVAGLNAKESELLNALELARHRALVTGNKDLGGLAWLTLNPARFAAFMADRSPLFKSIIARMMNEGSKNAPTLGAAAGAALPQNKEQANARP